MEDVIAFIDAVPLVVQCAIGFVLFWIPFNLVYTIYPALEKRYWKKRGWRYPDDPKEDWVSSASTGDTKL